MNKFMHLKKALDTADVSAVADKIPGIQMPGTMEVQSPFTSQKDTMHMTPLQWLSTLDPDFKTKYPHFAALNEISSPTDYKTSLPYNLGGNLKGYYNKYKNFANPILDSGPLLGGLYSMAPGAVLGGLGTGLYNIFSGNDFTENMGRNTAIGAGLGGLLGAVSGYHRTNDVAKSDPNVIQTYSPDQIAKIRELEKAVHIDPALKQTK